MDIEMIANNLLAGPILFFLFGFVAVTLKAEIELPQPLPKLLSMFLVIAIGLKGGHELRPEHMTGDCLTPLLLAIGFASAVPLYCFFLLKSHTTIFNAGAICATYGSVSAVTFITAVSALDGMGIHHSGFMVAAMALMEAPAIIIGVMLVQYYSKDDSQPKLSVGKVLHDALLHGPILLLLGSLVIGRLITGTSHHKIAPFFEGLFPGVLCLYLFEMGLSAARRLTAMNLFDNYLIGFSIVVPLVNGAAALGACYFFNLPQGDAILLTVLCASASYVAVPAAMQLALPKAETSLYMTMALGITFPFNIAIGIPLYVNIAKSILAA